MLQCSLLENIKDTYDRYLWTIADQPYYAAWP